MNNKVLIVAELSANHNNDFNLTVKTLEAMAKAGADAVKIQTFTADSISLNVENEFFSPIKNGLWKGRMAYELFKEASMPYEWQPKLKKIAEELGLIFFSTPFDLEAVDFLHSMDVKMYKIASLEITDIQLIEYVASKHRPVIISTGVANKEDIQLAIDTCYSAGNQNITLLKCTSQYPAKIEEANLLTIPDMKKIFGVEVGVSDHTTGTLVPVVAVSLGAKIVEKHFTLSRNLGGPDSAFSMEPHEFQQMVHDIRSTEIALGKVCYDVEEKDLYRRRSIFVVKDMRAGDIITEDNTRSIRPGYGLHPKYYKYILGKRVLLDLKKGDPMKIEYVKS
jgi:pseudaminic acid synthase